MFALFKSPAAFFGRRQARPRTLSTASATGSGTQPTNGHAWRPIMLGASCVLLLVAMGLIPVTRRALVSGGLAAIGAAPLAVGRARAGDAADLRRGEVAHSEQEWRALLGDDLAYRVLRQAATERPNTSPLNQEKRAGTFMCAGCGAALFDAAAKFNSGTGWPSFFDVLPGAVDETDDRSIPFMPRVEVRCHRCQGHLGHVFDDGPPPTGLRYCMNGAAMKFEPAA